MIKDHEMFLTLLPERNPILTRVAEIVKSNSVGYEFDNKDTLEAALLPFIANINNYCNLNNLYGGNAGLLAPIPNLSFSPNFLPRQRLLIFPSEDIVSSLTLKIEDQINKS